jgi:preprotein translocase subunit YajC
MSAVLISFGLLAVLWFVMIVLPQRRRIQAHQALVARLEPGDRVMSSAGIYGDVRAIDEETIDLEVAPGVVVTLAKGAIAAVVTEPPDGQALDTDSSMPDDGDS